MIQVGVAFIVGIFCMMMMSTVMLSHFNRRLGLEYNQSENPACSIPHAYSSWNCLRRGEFPTSKRFDIRRCHRYRLCSSSLERIFHDESVEGFTIIDRQICKTTFSICVHRIFLLPLLSLVSIAPIWTGHEGIANIQPTHWLLISYSCFFVVCGFAIFLHEDHLHYSPSTRITHWHLVLMFLACGVLMTWSLYDGAVFLDGEYLPVYIWIGTQSVASLCSPSCLFDTLCSHPTTGIECRCFTTDSWKATIEHRPTSREKTE